MKERPILFSAPMVRAILAGDKTQTRRVAKPVRHPDLGNIYTPGAMVLEREPQHVIERACPYGRPGDRLWVRETFVQGFEYDAVKDRLRQFDEDGNELPKKTWYRATDSINWSDDAGWETNVPWKPSIHMPRSACRILLEVTGVRVERLQDIGERDAVAEGITAFYCGPAHDVKNPTLWGVEKTPLHDSPTDAFRHLWEAISGASIWDANPWVWVVEFRRVK